MLELLDSFEPAEAILARHGFTSQDFGDSPFLPQASAEAYFSLQDHGVGFTDIQVVMESGIGRLKELCSATEVSIDTESCLLSNTETATVQISTDRGHYFLPWHTYSPAAKDRCRQLLAGIMADNRVYKLGVAMEADVHAIMVILADQARKDVPLLNYFDVQKVFLQTFPTQNKCSLSHMSQALCGLKVSKFDQQSLWSVPVLSRRMLHYAMLDAYLPFVLRDRLRRERGFSPDFN